MGTIGLFLTLLAIMLSALYQAFSHVKEETEFRTHTNDKLLTIDASVQKLNLAIDAIRGQLAKESGGSKARSNNQKGLLSVADLSPSIK